MPAIEMPTLEQAKAFTAGLDLFHELCRPAAGDVGAMGKIDSICCHWTAGGYVTASDHYGINIEWNRNKPNSASVVQTRSYNDKGSHLWGRNTGCFGVSVCAMGDTTDANGKRVILTPKQPQLWAMAYTIACLCGIFGLDINGKLKKPKKQCQGETLVTLDGTIDAPVVADHAWYAVNDRYYPDRWDIGSQSTDNLNYFAPMLKVAVAFRQWIVDGKIPNRLKGWLS